MAKLKGWISATEDERALLESLGVRVGEFTRGGTAEGGRGGIGGFQCTLDDDALERLEPYWLRPFVWYFEPVEDAAYVLS